MTELESKGILEQVYLERYKNDKANKILSVLNNASKKIAEEIKKTDGVYTKARCKEIEKALKSISEKLSENIDSVIAPEEIVEYELNAQKKLLERMGGIADITLPSVEQVMSAVDFTPFTNKTYKSMLNEIDSRFYDMWDSSVRSGYLTGQMTKAIVKDVIGTMAKGGQLANYGKMQSLYNSVMMNTRTALQSFANTTRQAVYRKNDKYFKGYKWYSTLDRRSCLVCGELDGKFFKDLKDIPSLPMHPNCRCITLPVVKGLDDMDLETERVSEYGLVEGKLTYSEWIKSQPDSVQRDILGKTRYDYWKKSGEDLTVFVADNQTLTISELKEKL